MLPPSVYSPGKVRNFIKRGESPFLYTIPSPLFQKGDFDMVPVMSPELSSVERGIKACPPHKALTGGVRGYHIKTR